MARSPNCNKRIAGRSLSLLLAIAIALLVRAPLSAQDLRVERFQDYVEALRVQAGIPGLAAAIVDDNAILWEYASGQQDLERFIATRTDTPFHLDGLTQMFVASIVLRCVEDGTLVLDDRIGHFKADSTEPDATIAQLLSHTSGPPGGQVFAYRPERLDPLRLVIRACAAGSYRKSLGNLLERLAMIDSVPGPDVNQLVPPAEGIPTPEDAQRYASVLGRLATPYAVDDNRRASPSQYAATTLTPAGGLISTVRDFSQFMLALRQGVLLRPETLATAWRAPVGADGLALPHGLGWFVQSYNGETVVWQFGVGANSSSSLLVTVPSRGLTLILVANSDGLATPFPLEAGDLQVSPFGLVFLRLFVR